MGTRTSRGSAAKAAAFGVVACVVAACSGAGAGAGANATTTPFPRATTPSDAATVAPGCLVAEAWNNYSEERLGLLDQPAIEGQIQAAGGRYVWADAKSSADTQVEEIGQFVKDGAKVIIVRPMVAYDTDAASIRTAIDRATAAGVAVIVYDYVIDSPKALYVAFDPVEAGRMEARAVLAAKPTGNYVILKGHSESQVLPVLIANGIHEVLQPAIDKGEIKIVDETFTQNWDPYLAQLHLAYLLPRNGKIDAVIAESNGMASGAVAALKEVGLDGKVAVAGYGASEGGNDDPTSHNHIAAGTQTVDVWTNARLMAKAAGDAAVALCADPDISKLSGTTKLALPGRGEMTSLLIAPQPITRDNLKTVIDEGWFSKEEVCQDIPAGTTPACP